MNKRLLFQATTKFLLGLLLVALLLFLPAGTVCYWQAWLFIGVLFVPMLIMGTVLMCRNPELLRHRLDAREKEGEQKTAVILGGLLFVAVFIMAGLNFRYRWVAGSRQSCDDIGSGFPAWLPDVCRGDA